MSNSQRLCCIRMKENLICCRLKCRREIAKNHISLSIQNRNPFKRLYFSTKQLCVSSKCIQKKTIPNILPVRNINLKKTTKAKISDKDCGRKLIQLNRRETTSNPKWASMIALFGCVLTSSCNVFIAFASSA